MLWSFSRPYPSATCVANRPGIVLDQPSLSLHVPNEREDSEEDMPSLSWGRGEYDRRFAGCQYEIHKLKRKYIFSIAMDIVSSPLQYSGHRWTEHSKLVIDAGHVTDVSALFVADPFFYRHTDGEIFLFYETWDNTLGRGIISVSVSLDNGESWEFGGTALVEPFHLSYPYIFVDPNSLGSVYMIPDTHAVNDIRLYRPVPGSKFPYSWEVDTTLLSGLNYVDASLSYVAPNYYLWTSVNHAEQCKLYVSKSLRGPYVEHPLSPVSTGPKISRMGGRIMVDGSSIYRFAQDASYLYGLFLRAMEVTELSDTTYREIEVNHNPVGLPSGDSWARCGTHHVDLLPLNETHYLRVIDTINYIDP